MVGKRSAQGGRDTWDWVIVQLGAVGVVERLVVDTAHFRGNFPQAVRVFAATEGVVPGYGDGCWVEILGRRELGADMEHVFEGEVLKEVEGKGYGYVMMVVIPDGGVKRLRVWGRRMGGS